MEPICRVQTAITRKLYREIYWTLRTYRKSEVVKLIISGIVLMGLLLYELVEIIPFLPWLSPFSSVLSVVTVGIAIFGLYRIVFGARIYARKIEKKRIAAVGDRTVFAEILFNDTYFCYCSAIAKVQSSIAYTEVEALRETENYYLVFLRSGNDVYFFSKNGFVQGTLEQALQLLGRR